MIERLYDHHNAHDIQHNRANVKYVWNMHTVTDNLRGWWTWVALVCLSGSLLHKTNPSTDTSTSILYKHGALYFPLSGLVSLRQMKSMLG